MRNLIIYFILAIAMLNTVFTKAATARQAPENLKQAPVLVGQSPRTTTEDKPEPVKTNPPETNATTSEGSRQWTTIEIVLSVSVLIFALLIFMIQTVLIMKLKLNWTPNAILRFNGLTLIITGGILLVTAGYSNQQMAPVIGLLGAIAGYLLGAVETSGKAAPSRAE